MILLNSIERKSGMKKLVLLFGAAFCCLINLYSQNDFKTVQLTSTESIEAFPSWSPDGKFIVYEFLDMSDSPDKTGLWILNLNTMENVQIFKGIAEHPKFSPDGKYIVFDGDSGTSVQLIPSEGGTAENIMPDSIRIFNGSLPCWSPDGSKIAFIGGGTRSLCVMDMNTRQVRQIYQAEDLLPLPGCWTKDGNSILSAVMDFKTRKTSVLKISADGKSVKQIKGHDENFYRYLELSPDGSLLVYGVFERDKRKSSLWIMPAEGGSSILLTTDPGNKEAPSWSPDGKFIAFNSTRAGNCDVWMIEVDIAELQKKLGATKK